jgi:hypothetical protein
MQPLFDWQLVNAAHRTVDVYTAGTGASSLLRVQLTEQWPGQRPNFGRVTVQTADKTQAGFEAARDEALTRWTNGQYDA